jgi:hypothetical protein
MEQSMGLRHLHLLMVATLLTGTVCTPRAQADEFWTLVQFTCAPELNYFMVRTFGLHNPPTRKRGQVRSVLDKRLGAVTWVRTAGAVRSA